MSWNQLPQHEQHELRTRLTDRQLSCYWLWLAGCTYTRIGEMLLIQPRTVRDHIRAATIKHRQIQTEQENAA